MEQRTPLVPWVELLFPVWTLMVSVHLLMVTLSAPTD